MPRNHFLWVFATPFTVLSLLTIPVARQMKILKDFIEGFAFTTMHPVREAITAPSATVYALAETGKHYAAYLHGNIPSVTLEFTSRHFQNRMAERAKRH